MTVICVRDSIMAADSAVHYATNIGHQTLKVIRSKEGALFGCTGKSTTCQQFRNSVLNNTTFKLPPDQLYEFHAIRLDEDGVCISEDALTWIPLTGPFNAIGAGSDMAIGAMALGASANEAVEACIRYSSLCGGTVTSLHLQNF